MYSASSQRPLADVLFREHCGTHTTSCIICHLCVTLCYFVQATKARFPHVLFREHCGTHTTSCILCLCL
jgi:hypothetical protein